MSSRRRASPAIPPHLGCAQLRVCGRALRPSPVISPPSPLHLPPPTFPGPHVVLAPPLVIAPACGADAPHRMDTRVRARPPSFHAISPTAPLPQPLQIFTARAPSRRNVAHEIYNVPRSPTFFAVVHHDDRGGVLHDCAAPLRTPRCHQHHLTSPATVGGSRRPQITCYCCPQALPILPVRSPSQHHRTSVRCGPRRRRARVRF